MSYQELDLSNFTINKNFGDYDAPERPGFKSRLLLNKRSSKGDVKRIVIHHSAGHSGGEHMITFWEATKVKYIKDGKEQEYKKGEIHSEWQGGWIKTGDPNSSVIKYGNQNLQDGNYFIKNYDPDLYHGIHSERGGDDKSIGIEVITPGFNGDGFSGGKITYNSMLEDGFNKIGISRLTNLVMYEFPEDFSYALGQWCSAQCSRYNIPKQVLCNYVDNNWITTNNIDDFKEKINFSPILGNFSNFSGITFHFHTSGAESGKLDISPSLFYGKSGESFFQGLKNGGIGGSSLSGVDTFEIDVQSGKTYTFYYESEYLLKKNSLTQTLMAPVYSQPLTSGEKINNDKIKEIVKQIVYSKFDAVNTLDPNRMSLVALEFNILLDGISGISIGDVIDCEFLPDIYRKNTVITITGVEHEISGNDWKTNLKITVKAIQKQMPEESNKNE